MGDFVLDGWLSFMLGLFGVWDEFLCWVFFFFFFLIKCVGVLGLHDGDGGDEW